MRAGWIIGTALVCGLLALAAPAQTVLDPLVVNGERTGPRLWHVRGDAGELWILGTVSPLPVGVRWRASEVERRLTGADAVLLAKPLEISAPRVLWMFIAQRDLLLIKGGRKLRDILPPDLYGRFAAQRLKYTGGANQWDRYRPLIAGALLEDAALQKNGLSTRLDVSLAVRRLARDRHVKIDEVKIPGATDLLQALKTVTPDAENRCIGAMLDTVEHGMPAMVARAAAWSSGDLEKIQVLPESTEAACSAALAADPHAGGVLETIQRNWLDALERHARSGGVAVAVVEMDDLLGPGGLLNALRADGFTVEAP